MSGFEHNCYKAWAGYLEHTQNKIGETEYIEWNQ